MQKQAFGFFIFILLLALASTSACKHEPMDDSNGNGNPTDTTGGNPTDTTGTGIACDPDSVYFQNQILPILVSNCAKSGCHDAASQEDGVITTSYQTIMSTIEGVKETDWSENKLMKVLVLEDGDDRMPQPPNDPLTQDQIDLIATWVNQGAKNNYCDANAGGCDTSNVKFSTFVQPLINTQCKGCHSGAAPSGGVALTSYSTIKTAAQNGKLYSSITRTSNWMPQGGAKLDQCSTARIKAWIDAGAPNN